MIVYDGIIYHLQKTGGISVLFNELISRLPSGSYRMVQYGLRPGQVKPRFAERYRTCKSGGPYSIFHSTYYRLPAYPGGKIVTTVHDFTYEKYAGALKRSVHSLQKNRAINKADKIICVSESTKQDLLNYCGEHLERKVEVVHNGVSADYNIIDAVNVFPQVVFVGARSGYKNFSALVYALRTLPEIKLVCVGGGVFTSEETSLLEKELTGRYTHAGYLSNQELNLLYNMSLCLVYPSLYEGFGIPVLEAMRAGCPVIAVGKSSIPEVAGKAAYLLDRGEVEEIREGVEFFLDVANRHRYITLGIGQSSKFTWDRTFEQTMLVYQQLEV